MTTSRSVNQLAADATIFLVDAIEACVDCHRVGNLRYANALETEIYRVSRRAAHFGRSVLHQQEQRLYLVKS